MKNKKDDEQKLKQLWHALNNHLHDAGIFIGTSSRYLTRTDWQSFDREKLIDTLTELAGSIDRLEQKLKDASKTSHELMRETYTALGFEVQNKPVVPTHVKNPQTTQPGVNLKLLIIENVGDILNSYAEAAKEVKNITVMTAARYKDAKELIEKEKPELILLDIYLDDPQYTGVDLLMQAKSINPKCSVAVITGGADSIVHAEVLRKGASRIYFKPILDFSEITDIIEDIKGAHTAK